MSARVITTGLTSKSMHGHESWHQQLPSAYQSMATNLSPCAPSHAAQHSAGDAVQPTFSSSVDMHQPTPDPWFVVPAMSLETSEPPLSQYSSGSSSSSSPVHAASVASHEHAGSKHCSYASSVGFSVQVGFADGAGVGAMTGAALGAPSAIVTACSASSEFASPEHAGPSS